MKTKLHFFKKTFMISALLFLSATLFAQTNPTAQSLPYSQDFGTTTFTSMPAGTATWTVNSSPIGSQTNAQNSTASGDATVTAATSSQTTGGTYGYCTSSNGRLYIQTSSNGTNGTNQLCAAISTIGYNDIKVSYSVEMISSNPRTIGFVLQYRIGTTGAWTNVTGGVYAHNNADRTNGQVDNYTNLSLPSATGNNAVVQLRWASWRGTQSGNSSGAAIDNISITASSSQTIGYFRSVQSGNWNDLTTWEASLDSVNWYAANVSPKYTANTITIQSGHQVYFTATDTIDQVIVNGTLTYIDVSGSTMHINNGAGTDLIINGTFEDLGPNSIVWNTSSTWKMGTSGTLLRTRSTSSDNWRDSYSGGISTIPATANWIIRKTGGDSPTLSSTNNMYYPNLTIENNTGSIWITGTYSSFTGYVSAPTIKGSLYVGGNGSNNVSFLNSNTYSSPVVVDGALNIKSGSILRNYGTGFSVLGDLDLSGTVDYGSSTATIILSGNANQNLSSSDTLRFKNFQLNKALTLATITLLSPASVSGTFTFTKGYIITSATNILTFKNHATAVGANDSSFVKGSVKKIGNSAFTFPIGKGNNYQPLGISAPTDSTDAFTAEYFNTGQTYGAATDPTFNYISTCEYFNLDRNTGTSNVIATLGYDLYSCIANMYPGPRIIGWDGTKWKDLGFGSFTYSPFGGTVGTDGSLSQYGPLTFGNNPDDFTFPTDTAEVPNSFAFIKNNGQLIATNDSLRPDIKYYVPNTYPATYFSDSTLYYVFARIDTITSTPDTLVRINVKHLGANINNYPVAQKRYPWYTNYFLAHCPAGIVNVPESQRLNYSSLYPHVDLIYSGINSGLAMTYILRPGFNLDLFKVRYTGADSVKIISGGKLCIYSPLGNIVYQAPAAFNIDSLSNINYVNCQWLMLNDSTVTLRFPGWYNQQLPIVVRVDKGHSIASTTAIQNLEWSSYYGGNNNDWFQDIKIAPNGDVYVAGASVSTNFPVTAGVYHGTNAGNTDNVDVKFKSNNSRVWSTYFGGNGDEGLSNLVIDPTGYLFISGATSSTNLPMAVSPPAGAYIDSTFGGGAWDIFIMKLDTSGTNLIWSTYYGGNEAEEGTDMALDGLGNLYVTGERANPQTPLLSLPGAYNDSLQGTGIIIKFNHLLHRKWATLYGVTDAYCGVQSIGVDLLNNVYITGAVDTGNTAFPLVAPPGAFLDNTFGGGEIDAYITKFNANDSVVWSTYYGGSSTQLEDGQKIIVDNNTRKLYVLGRTHSSDFPFYYPGGNCYIDSTYNGSWDIFILKFDLATLALNWATYFGGNSFDETSGSTTFWNKGAGTVDKFGYLYISGSVSSTANFPVQNQTNMFYQATKPSAGSCSAFISVFKPSGELFWSTYFGGSVEEDGWGVAVYDTSRLYVVGATLTDENATIPFPIVNPTGTVDYTDGSFNNTTGPPYISDAFISRFSLTPIYAGITEHKIDNNHSIIIYPNPTSDIIHIKVNDNSNSKKTLRVFDITGELLINTEFMKDEIKTIDLSQYANGFYIIQVISKDYSSAYKIIKH